MNLEEAIANIGKDVVLDRNEIRKEVEQQLKEQPMQNYKIKVTPETSEEVQRLFFELGYERMVGGKQHNIPMKII